MTLIVGKRSNLSIKLHNSIENSVLISSGNIENNIDSILQYCIHDSINIIFNNFQPSTLLNDHSNFDEYIIKAILNTSKILTFLIMNKIKINKLIYTSSSSVYGNNKFCSEMDQVKPMNLQGALKVANEELIKRFCTLHNINYTITRIFNMYGGNDKFSVISKIIDSYLNNKTLNIINGGKGIRDYIHIDDIVNVYKILIDKTTEFPTILNIANGNGKRVIDLIHNLQSKGIVIKTNSIERDEISASIADVTQLNEIVDVEKFLDVKNFLFNQLRY